MKTFLFVSLFVTVLSATEKYEDLFKITHFQSQENQAEVGFFLAQNGTRKQSTPCFNLKEFLPDHEISTEFYSCIKDRRQSFAVIHNRNMCGFLTIYLVSPTIRSASELVKQIELEHNITVSEDSVAEKCEEIKKSLGEDTYWVEFDQLTVAMPDGNSDDISLRICMNSLILRAIEHIQKNCSNITLRTCLKESEETQIESYAMHGFKKSNYQYMTSSGLTVYEKQLS